MRLWEEWRDTAMRQRVKIVSQNRVDENWLYTAHLLPSKYLVELVLHTAVLEVVVCGVLDVLPDLGIDLRPDVVVVVWVDVHVLGDGQVVTEVLQGHNVAVQGKRELMVSLSRK